MVGRGGSCREWYLLVDGTVPLTNRLKLLGKNENILNLGGSDEENVRHAGKEAAPFRRGVHLPRVPLRVADSASEGK